MRPVRIVAFWLVLAVVAAQAADNPAEVFSPSRQPHDSRLKPFDLDHPAVFTASYPTREAWEKRAQELRTQVLVSQGLWPMPARTPLNAVIHGKIDRDDYTIEKVYFASMPGHYVCGNLYRPKNLKGKAPVVLNPHGHFNNGRFFEESPAAVKANLASGGEKREDGAKYPLQACAVGLCRLGCIVFHYDMVGNADSTIIPHRAGFNSIDAELRLQSFMGLQTWNSIRALDFVCELPDVDTTRIGVTGASGGGTQTFMLCAVDPRPTVSFPAVMVSANMQGGCICENASLLRVNTNNVELAALFAPKPQAMTGANDWTRDIETRGLPELKKIYGLYGAADKVNAKHYSFPHNYNQVSRELLYGWFNKHFHLSNPEPIVEKSFVPVSPRELSVFDADHPRPSDFVKADELRQMMTKPSDDQLHAMKWENPQQFHAVVKAALHAMCGTSLPEPGETKETKLSEQTLDDCVMWKGTVTRNGSGEEVPTVAVSPNQRMRSGVVVVWADSNGKAALFTGNGQLKPSVRSLTNSGATVVSADLFLIGEWNPPSGKPTAVPMPPQVHHQDIPFLGFWLGYNRSVVGQRVHDLLTVIGNWRSRADVSEIWLVGTGEAGPWAVLAKALAGDAVSRTAVDLNHFDFQNVKTADDSMLLPGALKYGGMESILQLCSPDSDRWARGRLFHHHKRWRASHAGTTTLVTGTSLLPANSQVFVRPQSAQAEELVDWLLQR
jgi:hypothetical protein